MFEKIYQKYQNDYDYDYSSNEKFEKVFHEHVDEEQSSNETFVVDEKIRSFFIEASKCIFNCRRCDEKFFFNNKFHYHLRRCKKIINSDKSKSKVFCNLITTAFFTRRVIRFITFSNFAFDFEFRSWRYAKMKTNINSITSKILNNICIDNDVELFMTNRSFLQTKISNYVSKMLRKKKSLKINDIDFVVVKINEYIFIDFTISNEINEKTINVTFTRHVYIVKNLKTNIFLNNDILKSKNIVSHVDKRKIIIENCDNFFVSLIVIVKNEKRVKRIVRAQTNAVILTHFYFAISIKIRDRKLSNRDFMFNFEHIKRLNKKNEIFTHIIDVNFFIIQIRNIIDESIIIKRSERLNILVEYEKKNCYFVNSKVRHFAAKSWNKRVLKLSVVVFVEVVVFIEIVVIFSFFNFVKSINQSAAFNNVSTLNVDNNQHNQFNQKYVMFIDITMYDIHDIAQQITSIAKVFFNFWKNDDATINFSSNEWMLIKLQFDVKIVFSKMYSIDQIDKNFIDQKFDKFQRQKKLKYIIQFTLFNYLMFVVWRTIHKSNESSKRKNKIVINIRDLNKIIKRDIYSMLLQTNVIVLIIDCFYISIFDAVSFFYQWLMQITNWHKLIVISHRKQKQFNVVVMNYINSSIYVQRKINVILRVFRVFVKAYVNDIVIFNKTLKKHLIHLHQIFQLLNSYNIRLSSKKSYLKYFIVALLNQKMNVFDFIIVANKLTIIVNLRFFYIFKNLKSYLNFIDWLRNYIIWYVQKSNSLQFRKTMLFRSSSSNKKRQRKMYFVKIILKKFFEIEIKFYNQLQKTFDKTELFIHHNFIRITYIDVNVFKRRDFDVVIYHLKFDANLNNFKQKKNSRSCFWIVCLLSSKNVIDQRS